MCWLVIEVSSLSFHVQVEALTRGSPIPSQCLSQSDICVLSFFHIQVKRIRSKLREKRLGQVTLYTTQYNSVYYLHFGP